MWYDINQTLSYNTLFNFIIGNRGGGKTFACKDWAIRDFLKSGSQFVYMRRYKQEFKKNAHFFDAIKFKYPDVQFSVDKSGTYLINDEPAGFPMPLSTAKIEKSNEFPKVNKIIFDEFIIDKGVYRYLTDEVTSFLEAYETISRMREVRVFFLSNAITISNPYFAYFDITLPYGSNIARKDDLLIQLVQNDDFIEAKKQTRFGKIIQGTRYAEYSIENKFLRDTKEFLAKKTGNARYLFTLAYMGVKYGIWVDYDAGLMYMSENVDGSCKFIFTTTTEDHKPNTLLLKQPKKDPLFAEVLKQFEYGNLRFESIKIKNVFLEIMKMTY